jgi:ribonuclease HII
LNHLICGVDEAGRGPLAGPLVVAAVVMTEDTIIEGIKDSKKLSEKNREFLYHQIIRKCFSFNIEIINNHIIDKINILQATMLGVKNCLKKLKCNNIKVFMDGNYLKFPDNSQKNYDFETIVKGDDLVFQISCASIIAKVTRDRLMKGFDVKYPDYNFHQNKGYPTKEHIKIIEETGTCEIHRMTFSKKFIKSKIENNVE